jgi:hypothetical protein
MTIRINHETARDRHPVEHPVTIPLVGSLFRFVVTTPRYIAGKLTPDDWIAAGTELRGERDRIVRRAWLTGRYLTAAGQLEVREAIKQSMCNLIYGRFQQKQIRAGEEAWEVPAMMQQGV